MKKFLTLLVVQLLCFSFFCFSALAEENPKLNDSANSWRYADGVPITDKYAASLITDPYHPNATLQGIDVSKHQGVIDWEKVKAAGIDFAIIRCGYAEDKTEYDDIKWEYNASECERLGIPYGVYLYSYAFNEAEARSEADHVLRLLKGHSPSLPIYYDMEDNSTLPYDHVAMANAFCQKISDAGYPVGIYASKYWWTAYLNDPSLDRWYRWVAQWGNECTYNGRYEVWQYSNVGRVDGISTDVDMNYLIGYPADHYFIKNVNLSGSIIGDGSLYDGLPRLSWTASEGATKYIVYRSEEKDGEAVTFETAATTFVDETAKAGKTYFYTVKACNAAGAYSKNSNTVELQVGLGVPETYVTTVNTSGKPKVKWNKVKKASGYEIYRKTSEESAYQQVGTTDKLHFVDYKAEAGTTYFYQVRSVYRGEEELKSFFSTPVYSLCRLPKLNVKAAKYEKEQLKLSWSSENNAKNYNIYRADSWNGQYSLVDTVAQNTYICDDKGFYKVEAIHQMADANGPVSSAVCGFYSNPATTVKTVDIKTEGETKVSWTKVKGATCYEVYCSADGKTGYKRVHLTEDNFYINNSAEAGGIYYYKIRAVYCPTAAKNS